MKRTPLLFDRYMTIDQLQRFVGVHDLSAKYYQALAKRTGIETFDQLSQQELKLVGLYKEVGEEMQKQRRNKMRGWILITVLVVMMLVLAGNVGAQDTKPTNPPVVGGTVVVATGDGSGRVTLEAGGTEDATLAPTETVEPPPTEEQPGEWREFIEVFMPYLTQIVIAVVIGLVALASGAIVVAGNGMPKWARDIGQSAINTGFDRAEQYVKDTPSKADDELLLQLREMVDKLFMDMQKVKSAVVPDTDAKALTEEDIEGIRRRAMPTPPLTPPRPGEGNWTPGRDFPEGG